MSDTSFSRGDHPHGATADPRQCATLEHVVQVILILLLLALAAGGAWFVIRAVSGQKR